MKRVVIEIPVTVTVELPDEYCSVKVLCDDPAIECALMAFCSGDIYLWGQDKPPAHVCPEVFEEDAIIEEDER